MKVIPFLNIPETEFALTDISVIYQTPVWDRLGNMNGLKGRKLNGFLLIREGQCRYEWKGGQATLGPGSLIYLGKGCKKTVFVTQRPFSFYRISFTMTELASGEPVIFSEIPWVVTDNAGNKLYELSETMRKTTLSRNAGLKNASLLYDFFDQLCRHHRPEKKNRIQPALEYLESHYTEDVSIQQLADMCILSQSQFFAAFKKEMGMSPIRYKNHLRIRQAKQLLADEECTAQEIALMLGFENIYYFSRVFKEHTGVSPSKYIPE